MAGLVVVAGRGVMRDQGFRTRTTGVFPRRRQAVVPRLQLLADEDRHDGFADAVVVCLEERLVGAGSDQAESAKSLQRFRIVRRYSRRGARAVRRDRLRADAPACLLPPTDAVDE